MMTGSELVSRIGNELNAIGVPPTDGAIVMVLYELKNVPPQQVDIDLAVSVRHPRKWNDKRGIDSDG